MGISVASLPWGEWGRARAAWLCFASLSSASVLLCSRCVCVVRGLCVPRILRCLCAVLALRCLALASRLLRCRALVALLFVAFRCLSGQRKWFKIKVVYNIRTDRSY